jgi:ribosomal protein S27E
MKSRRRKGKPPKDKPPRPFVIARCVTCGNKRKVFAGEVGANDMPECEKCYSIMVAEGAGSE